MLVSQTVAGLSFEMSNTCRRGMRFLLPALPAVRLEDDKPPRGQTLPLSSRVPAARGETGRAGALLVPAPSAGPPPPHGAALLSCPPAPLARWPLSPRAASAGFFRAEPVAGSWSACLP